MLMPELDLCVGARIYIVHRVEGKIIAEYEVETVRIYHKYSPCKSYCSSGPQQSMAILSLLRIACSEAPPTAKTCRSSLAVAQECLHFSCPVCKLLYVHGSAEITWSHTMYLVASLVSWLHRPRVICTAFCTVYKHMLCYQPPQAHQGVAVDY